MVRNTPKNKLRTHLTAGDRIILFLIIVDKPSYLAILNIIFVKPKSDLFISPGRYSLINVQLKGTLDMSGYNGITPIGQFCILIAPVLTISIPEV